MEPAQLGQAVKSMGRMERLMAKIKASLANPAFTARRKQLVEARKQEFGWKKPRVSLEEDANEET